MLRSSQKLLLQVMRRQDVILQPPHEVNSTGAGARASPRAAVNIQDCTCAQVHVDIPVVVLVADDILMFVELDLRLSFSSLRRKDRQTIARLACRTSKRADPSVQVPDAQASG